MKHAFSRPSASAPLRSAGIAAGAVLWLTLVAVAGGLTACSEPTVDVVRAQRKELGDRNYQDGKDIDLAVVWNSSNGGFRNGALLAAEEINAAGGVAGHRIHLVFTDEAHYLERKSVERTLAEGRYRNALQQAGTAIARAVVADPNVTGVIGHTESSEATLSEMLTYQDNGVLFLSDGTTDSRVMWSSDHLYFQLQPQDEVLAKRMAAEIRKRKWHTVYFVYDGTRHNEDVVDLLKTQLAHVGVKFAGSIALLSGLAKSPEVAGRLQSSLASLREDHVDALVLLTPPLLGAQVVRLTRSLGILLPYIGTSKLDSPEFIKTAGEPGVGTLVTSLYRSESYQVRRFSERYKKRFPGAVVDEAATMGYDGVGLYAQGVASAGSTDPFLVAQALNYKLPIWYGLLGTYGFDQGTNTKLDYQIRELVRHKNGKLEFVAADPAN